jgi:hypothetical protein
VNEKERLREGFKPRRPLHIERGLVGARKANARDIVVIAISSVSLTRLKLDVARETEALWVRATWSQSPDSSPEV